MTADGLIATPVEPPPRTDPPVPVALPGTGRQAYALHQHVRYDYPAPVRNLEHRLMVVPPPTHGDQVRVRHVVAARGAEFTTADGTDAFGNCVASFRAGLVAEAVEFDAWVVVERSAGAGTPARLPAAALADPRYLGSSPLTRPDGAVRAAATELAAAGDGNDLALAERVTSWVHRALVYDSDATDVATTAGQALALGRGVCQDYAHVMLAVARTCGLPARYVSGHLVGEGGSHAWVEVLVRHPRRRGLALAVPFDPTHDRRAGAGYVTVAMGRDYRDVPPTSGTFEAPHRGRLSARKHLEALAPGAAPTRLSSPAS